MRILKSFILLLLLPVCGYCCCCCRCCCCCCCSCCSCCWRLSSFQFLRRWRRRHLLPVCVVVVGVFASLALHFCLCVFFFFLKFFFVWLCACCLEIRFVHVSCFLFPFIGIFCPIVCCSSFVFGNLFVVPLLYTLAAATHLNINFVVHCVSRIILYSWDKWATD